VVAADGRTIGVPAGAWAVGEGDGSLDFTVDRVVDMGNHLHAVGQVHGTRVDVRLRGPDPVPAPGDRVRIRPLLQVPVG
ncbi:MAG TPA: TOBE domain-containing protein, partial [Gemmatimonadales bacterium]